MLVKAKLRCQMEDGIELGCHADCVPISMFIMKTFHQQVIGLLDSLLPSKHEDLHVMSVCYILRFTSIDASENQYAVHESYEDCKRECTQWRCMSNQKNVEANSAGCPGV